MVNFFVKIVSDRHIPWKRPAVRSKRWRMFNNYNEGAFIEFIFNDRKTDKTNPIWHNNITVEERKDRHYCLWLINRIYTIKSRLQNFRDSIICVCSNFQLRLKMHFHHSNEEKLFQLMYSKQVINSKWFIFYFWFVIRNIFNNKKFLISKDASFWISLFFQNINLILGKDK